VKLQHLSASFALAFFFLFSSVNLYAATGAKLAVLGDIVIYSGPSVRYRPLATASKGQSFPVSLRRVIGAGGVEFFKVLLRFRNGGVRIGYISVTDPVEIQTSDVNEDVDSYQSLALAKSAVQFSFGGLKDGNYEVAAGYLVFPAPDFYLKAFAGQFVTPVTGNPLLGVEMGLDHLITGAFSIYGLVNTGAVFPANPGSIFAGSSSVAEFLQGGFGLRYNAHEFAAVSLGMIETGLYSNDNSFISSGYYVTLEVGL